MLMDKEDLDAVMAVGQFADAVSDSWELVWENPHPESAPSSSSVAPSAPGAWATPAMDRIGLAPGCRIQRRTPTRSFQVFVSQPGVGFVYSKVFKWSDEEGSMERSFEDALSWSWLQNPNS